MTVEARAAPPNKNMEKQFRFFPTKKKKRKNMKKIRFEKPTREEK